jgi:hypothetical protein
VSISRAGSLFDAEPVDAVTVDATVVGLRRAGVQAYAVERCQACRALSRFEPALLEERADPDVRVVHDIDAEGAVRTIVIEIALGSAPTILTDELPNALLVIVAVRSQRKIAVAAKASGQHRDQYHHCWSKTAGLEMRQHDVSLNLHDEGLSHREQAFSQLLNVASRATDRWGLCISEGNRKNGTSQHLPETRLATTTTTPWNYSHITGLERVGAVGANA